MSVPRVVVDTCAIVAGFAANRARCNRMLTLVAERRQSISLPDQFHP
ncbi:MAG: hypothetical protein QOD56_2396 [Gammaproteobacteria bacterium]|nr:hypothetical protein [Gammaproteobacteria bacterium]